MRKNQNPVAGDDGVLKIDAQLGGEHHYNSPPPVTLQISRLASRFGLPIATATVFAEIIFHTESRG
jgi:hypothetical protein